jgi:hypothetical protein
LGPTWLHRLRPAVLDAAASRVALLDRLPVMCAVHKVGTGEPIILKRGETGYWLLPSDVTVDEFNAAFQPTPAQLAAMEAGSIFGWDVPGADPANYDANGRPLSRG